ncbi:MAG: flagellar hook-basal body complex protein FliE [Armatimonadota bacterium]
MSSPFLPIQPIQPLGDFSSIFTQNSTSPVASGEGSFASFLTNELSKVTEAVAAPDKLAGDLATGDIDNLHRISIENAKADVLLKLATKVMSSLAMDFKTLMQMQI